MAVNRRGALTGAGLLAAALTQPAIAAGTGSGLRVAGLKANNAADPLGVESRDVRLSWQLISSLKATKQTAWRVEVASSEAALKAGQSDLWDSGRIADDATFDITYAGKPLVSRQRAAWRVTVWDSHGRTATSTPACWEMGLLSPEDWRAQWLAAEDADMRGDREAGFYWITAGKPPKDQTQQVRLGFTLTADAGVTLMMTAGGGDQVFIDGAPVALPPRPATAWGPPPAVETTVALKAGPHVLAMATREAQCALMVRARVADGRVVRYSGLDARASSTQPDGWNLPGFDDAGWQGVARAQRTDQPLPGKGAFLMRRDFAAKGAVARARLYVTALGACEAYINGVRVGDGLLAPECMDFARTIRYRVFDVTQMLRDGANTIGAMVGDGWYGSYTGPFGRFAFGEAPLRLIAQLELTYADGQVQTVTTDEAWTLSASAVVKAEIYDGEYYDARLEQPGWAEPGFASGAGWAPARIAPPVTGRLEATTSPPIRRIRALKALAVTAMNGAWVIDFGQNFAGWVRIRVKGQAGQTITLKYAEMLKADGSIDQANLRGARAVDTYVLKGDPIGETWEPRFTYHGFRYVEISGLPAGYIPGEVTGIVIHSDLRETGHLRIGNPIIQKLWQNSLWSQKSNFMGIPTDCPQRDERLGWMGDAHVFWDAAAFNMDVDAFTRRWMADVRDAQWPGGAFAFIAPNTMRDTGPDQASPGWADAGVILPWTAWQRYGDTAIIDQNWEAMTRYIGFIEAHSDNHIWARGHGWDFGDWLALDSRWPGDHTTPPDLIGTAMWKHSTDAMIDMARATGRTEAAERFAAMAARIGEAFVKTYVRPDGTVGNDSQTGYILALNYDLVPMDLRPALAARLRDNIVRRGNLLTTGFLGTPASLDVLADAGLDATVYDLLLRTDYPSWGYMVMKGATTTWERWNSDAGDVTMNSFNHYALGAVIGFVYRRIAGIDPIAPGFSRFRVNPVLDARIASGGADYDAMPGRISTDWTLGKGRFRLKLRVPANSHAEVHLPAPALDRIREDGRPVALRSLGVRDGRVVLEAGSGDYDFAVKL